MARLATLLFIIFHFLWIPAAFAQANDGPEEPDYAFVAGSPYTETKRFLQVILNDAFTQELDAGTTERELANFVRFEYGLTDRLEADLVVPFNNQWNTASGNTINVNGFGTAVLGLRYRILRESQFPITLTFGPQLLPPTASFSKGFGNGGFGLAWDLTTAREWNRWFFHYLSFNYATSFAAQDPTAGSLADFTLHQFTWAFCLGFKPLETETSSGARHDLHLTLEMQGTFEQSVEAGTTRGTVSTDDQIIFVPGVRYGYITRKKFLSEVGLGGLVGVTSSAPNWGVILQTQFEFGF